MSKKLKDKIAELKEKNKKLQDEVDSLWAMMDEMTRADIENWKHLFEDLEKDVAIRALMVSKKKVDA
jgi:FtsZ-binding cell division protein ZapB